MEPKFVTDLKDLNQRLEDYLLQEGHSKEDDAYDALLNQTLALWSSLTPEEQEMLNSITA